MKSYEEIAESVFKRRDEYFEKKRKKRIVMIRSLTAVAGTAAMLLLGIGIWNNKDIRNAAPSLHEDPYSMSELPTEETTSSITTSDDISVSTTFYSDTTTTNSSASTPGSSTTSAAHTSPSQTTPAAASTSPGNTSENTTSPTSSSGSTVDPGHKLPTTQTTKSGYSGISTDKSSTASRSKPVSTTTTNRTSTTSRPHNSSTSTAYHSTVTYTTSRPHYSTVTSTASRPYHSSTTTTRRTSTTSRPYHSSTTTQRTSTTSRPYYSSTTSTYRSTTTIWHTSTTIWYSSASTTWATYMSSTTLTTTTQYVLTQVPYTTTAYSPERDDPYNLYTSFNYDGKEFTIGSIIYDDDLSDTVFTDSFRLPEVYDEYKHDNVSYSITIRAIKGVNTNYAIAFKFNDDEFGNEWYAAVNNNFPMSRPPDIINDTGIINAVDSVSSHMYGYWASKSAEDVSEIFSAISNAPPIADASFNGSRQDHTLLFLTACNSIDMLFQLNDNYVYISLNGVSKSFAITDAQYEKIFSILLFEIPS